MWLPPPGTSQGSLFLLQAWDELLSLRTPETFRLRYAHLDLLVAELYDVAGFAMEDER